MEQKQFGALLRRMQKRTDQDRRTVSFRLWQARPGGRSALSGLLSLRLNEYPVFAGFTSSNYDSYAVVASDWGESETVVYLTARFEALSPKVVVHTG